MIRIFLNPAVSHSGLDRCLRRHGVSSLKEMIAERQEPQGKKKYKAFKDYIPGFIHVDIKYLPVMQVSQSVSIWVKENQLASIYSISFASSMILNTDSSNLGIHRLMVWLNGLMAESAKYWRQATSIVLRF